MGHVGNHRGMSAVREFLSVLLLLAGKKSLVATAAGLDARTVVQH